MSDPNQDEPAAELQAPAPPAPTSESSSKSEKSELSAGLERLSGADSEDEEEYIPGEGDSRPPPASVPSLDTANLAELLEKTARSQTSALAKSRGLSVASLLFERSGESEHAQKLAHESIESSPKMSLAALIQRRLGTTDEETIERALESATRLAAHPASRAHATIQLAARHQAAGQSAAAGKVIDQAVRNGDGGPALRLQRLVHRVGTEQSLAGVELPSAHASSLSGAHEALFGTPLKSDGEEVAPAPHAKSEIAMLRAARAVEKHDQYGAVEALKHSSSTPSAVVQELEFTVAAAAQQRDVAIAQLKALVSAHPENRLRRELLTLCVEARDQDALGKALEMADPGSGTVEFAERILLESIAGHSTQLSRDDLVNLSDEDPELALALAPLDSPALVPEEATVPQLLVQAGAALASQPRNEENLQAALDELTNRGEEEELRIILRMLRSRRSDDLAGTAMGSDALATRLELPLSRLLSAVVLERLGESGQAGEVYEELEGRGDRHQVVVQRALSALAEEPQTREELDERIARTLKQLGVESLTLSAELKRALQSEGAELAEKTQEACLSYLNTLRDQETSPEVLSQELSGLLWACSSVCAHVGNESLAEDSRNALSALNSEPGRLAKLRDSVFYGKPWITPTDSAGTTAEGEGGTEQVESTDPSFAALALFDESATGRQSCSDVEHLLRATRFIAEGEQSSAAKELEGILALDPALQGMRDDLLESTHETAELSAKWMTIAKDSELPDDRRFAYEQLAQLDSAKGDDASALLFRKALVEEFPDDIPSLLRLEEAHLSSGEKHSSTGAHLAALLPPSDGLSYRAVSGALALANSDFRAARKILEPLLDIDKTPLLALRGLITIARERRDDDLLLRATKKLAAEAPTDLDKAATALECAFILTRTGEGEEAIKWTQQALKNKPGAFTAALLLEHLSQPEDPVVSAEQLETFAETVATAPHKKELWFLAGTTWEKAEDFTRAAHCFEQTLKTIPAHAAAFEKLTAIRESNNDWAAVRSLISARLELVSDKTSEKLTLELKLADLLAKEGAPEEAKEHLERALALHPDNSQALRAHADVSAQLGAHESAEKSLVALRGRLKNGAEKTAVIRSLARLYDEHLGQLERAMDAYQDVLSVEPNDDESNRSLVEVYCKLGLAERATSLQTKLIQKADTADKKRSGALELARLYETVAKDTKRASATLERTRKAWPLDADALEATVLFMDRQGNSGSRGFMLDRAAKDARRKLESERLDGALLDTIARVAKLSGHVAEAEAAASARAAYLGLDVEPLNGAGVFALGPKVDEVIAPRGFATPLRLLIQKTGSAMDAAFSVDLTQMNATPLTSGPTLKRAQQIAEALKAPVPELFVSPSLGARCVPITSRPPRLLVGSSVDDLAHTERDYLLLRGFKLQQLGAGALARSRDDDRWPMLVALLHLFAPSWRPAQVDGQKAAKAKALIEQGLARVGYDDDVPMLALEAIGAISGNPEGLGEAARVLANRAAMLAVGDIGAVLSAIAAGENSKLAPNGPSRFRWIESHQEAKDLVLFATGDKNARAREGLGLAEKSAPLPPGKRAPAGAPHAPHAPVAPGAPARPAAPGRPAAPSRAAVSPSGAKKHQDEAPPPPRRPKPPPPKR